MLDTYPDCIWNAAGYRMYPLYLEPNGPETALSVSTVSRLWLDTLHLSVSAHLDLCLYLTSRNDRLRWPYGRNMAEKRSKIPP